MSNGFEIIAKLREQYTDADDQAQIDRDEQRLKELLNAKKYALLEETQQLIAVYRKGIVTRRLRLATDNTLTDEQRRTLFAEIVARLDVLDMIGQDFDAEIAAMERDLRAQLEP